MITLKGTYTKAKVMIDTVEDTCRDQIKTFINHPAFTNPVAIMPDTHAGKGSVIGFTMRLSDKVIPNVVGVDIGCGMVSMNIGKELGLSLEMFDHKIRHQIPFGMIARDEAAINMEKEFPWSLVRIRAETFAAAYRNTFGFKIEPPRYNMDWFMEKCSSIGANTRRMINSLGSLGGGNHFIETGFDEQNENYWITIHSGSRNFGKRICDYWQGLAAKKVRKKGKSQLKEEIKRIKKAYSKREVAEKIAELNASQQNSNSVAGLEYLEGADAAGYLFDMVFAQVYAEISRKIMAEIITTMIRTEPLEKIETVHNYIDFHDFIIRKGAIRSYEGEKMIIPFNMQTGLLICEGKSNKEWNYSAPHGAGRIMSRRQAKKSIDMNIFKEQMKGIYSTSVCSGTLDEAPGAYKDPQIIEDAIGPTAEIIARIKPVHNMKDSMGSATD